MKISSEIASAAKIVGEEKTVEYMGKAGFDAWDFSMSAYFTYDWNKGNISWCYIFYVVFFNSYNMLT